MFYSSSGTSLSGSDRLSIALRYIIFMPFKHSKLLAGCFQIKFFEYLFVNEKGWFWYSIKVYVLFIRLLYGVSNIFPMVDFIQNLL